MAETMNPINAYQQELARRGLGSVFQVEGPESSGAGLAMAGPYGGMSAQEAMAAGASPEALRALGRQMQRGKNIDTVPETLADAEADIFSGDTLDLIRSYAPKSASIGNITQQRQMEADAADVAAKLEARPESMTGLEALEAPMASTLAGGRGTVVEQPGERPLGGRGKMVEAPGERAAALAGDSAEAETADPIQQGFMAGMQEYVNAVRGADGAIEPRSLEEYKKEFAEATGIDISGKPDKSQALMAFGLALMQNRAGKGFNVGRILRSVGEAGEAALPALEKAKQEARGNAIAAGKYALESRSADKAKAEAARKAAMDRKKYWVYQKGAPGAEFSGFDKGEFVDLNAVELDRLINNKDFDSQYEFIDASTRFDILKERAKGQDLGDAWGTTERVSLIGGKADDVPPELQAVVAVADPNYKGKTPNPYKLMENPESVIARFAGLQESITSGSQKFEKLIGAINSGVSIPEQMVSSVFTGLRNLGIDVGEQPTDITQARAMLKQIAVREATNILQESGKTLSDNDRKRVEDLVGEISFASADAELIKSKLKEIYELTVVKPQKNLDRAIGWLEKNTGVQFSGGSSGKPTQAELDAMNKQYGTSYTMKDFE